MLLSSFNSESVNFEGGINNDVSQIFSFNKGTINSSLDTLSVQVCVSDCPYVQNKPFLIDLIALIACFKLKAIGYNPIYLLFKSKHLILI